MAQATGGNASPGDGGDAALKAAFSALDASGQAGVLRFCERAGLGAFGPDLVAMGVDQVENGGGG